MTRRGQRPGRAQGRERASRPLGRRLQARVFRVINVPFGPRFRAIPISALWEVHPV